MQRMMMLSLLLLCGVCDAGTDGTVSVMEGEPVTLQTNLSEILNDDTILWAFGPKESVISQITRKNDLPVFFVTDDVRFAGRLQVDQQTGSLTIRNTRNKHSGQYKLTISREKTTSRIFHVDVFGVVGETDGVKSVSVKEGESVFLQYNAELQRDDLIVWRFGDKGILLAKIDVETKELSLSDADERFRNRLQLDQTGSLTITNARTEHAGLYEVQITGRESSQQFLVSVSADMGRSSTVIAGIVVTVLLAAGLLAAVVIYFRCTISELQKQVAVEEEIVSETEGRTVVLKTDTKLQDGDEIKWCFGDDDNPLTQVSEWTITDDDIDCDVTDERFRNKLQMGARTGDLIISYIRTIHSGVYKVQINGKTRRTKRFIVTVSAEEDIVSVIEGRTVALNTGTELQSGDEIKWWFGDDEKPITQISEWSITDTDVNSPVTDERFRNKLQLGHKNGDLIISYVRTIHAGVYKVQISGKTRRTKRFIVTVIVKKVPVKVGESVTLETDIGIQEGDVILWTFGVKNCLIFKAESGPPSINESFRGRLQLNDQNGSLTITNIKNEDFGHFQLQVLNSERNRFRRFNVIEASTENKVK